MTELLTSAQMRAIEIAAIESGKATGLDLMERAGQGVVDAILQEWPEYKDAPQSVSVLCGPGNNGGDGFVIARLLYKLGWKVSVYAMDTAKGAPDAAENRRKWADIGEIYALDVRLFRSNPATALYIDAIFGTGLTRPASGELGQFLRYLAGSGGDLAFYQPRLVAVDVPSGLCADSGRVLGCPDPVPSEGLAPFVRLTVTFDSPKAGHFLADGPAQCGKVDVRDIGIRQFRETKLLPERKLPVMRPPLVTLFPSLTSVPDSRQFMFSRVQNALEKRTGHKYSHGHAVVLSGHAGKTGAARLAARGALRIGAGVVSLGAPKNAMAEIAAHTTAIMQTCVDDPVDLSAFLKDARLNAICVGPAFGTEARQQELLEVVLSTTSVSRKICLDADALTLLAHDNDLFERLDKHCLLTPHMGEFARLFPDISGKLTGPKRSDGVDLTSESWQDAWQKSKAYRAELDAQVGPAYSKIDAVRDAAKRAGCTVLLKGSDTVIADEIGKVTVHSADYARKAPWLATAGAGDVLAGFATGLMARGLPPYDAAIGAAWLHVECARSFGPGLIAEDLPEELPKVFRKLAD